MLWSSLFYVLLILNYVNAPNTGPEVDPLQGQYYKEQRAFIKCHVLLDSPAAEVYSMLVKMAHSQILS